MINCFSFQWINTVILDACLANSSILNFQAGPSPYHPATYPFYVRLFCFSSFFFINVFRNSGMGMVSVASRIGAASSPFVVQMTRINSVLPFAVMGALSFIGAIMCWVLPETQGRRTAEVMEDNEKKEGQLTCVVSVFPSILFYYFRLLKFCS